MKRQAFTLIEALVTIAIICILAAILFPVKNGTREDARRSSCASKLKQIGIAFLQYANNYDEVAPPISNAQGGWMRLLSPYSRSEQLFQCPSARSKNLGTTDYFLNARLAGTQSKLGFKTNANTILCGEGDDDQADSYALSQWPADWRTDESSPPWRHVAESANILFADGHVKAYRAKRIVGKAETDGPTFEVKP